MGAEVPLPPTPPKEQARLEVWQRVHAQAVVKMGAGMILILGEFFSPGTNHFLPIDWEDPWRPFQHHNSWQHATIIAFFLLSALVDLTSQVWLAQLSMKLEWAVTALALIVIVLEMVALPEHRNTLEFRVHTMMMLPAFLLALVRTIKVWAPDQLSF